MKRALVLSGGGSKGAYQVGSLLALTESGRTWDSVHGISVGALNAAWIAMQKPQDLSASMFGLLEIWNNVKRNEDIYKRWAPFNLKYIFSMWKGSLHSGDPLRKIVTKFWNTERARQSGVNLTVGCCSLTTTQYHSFSQDNDNILEYILASSHLPIIFEPLLIDNELWIDGGLRHQIPILEALKEDPDEIDVIVTQPITNYKTAREPNKNLRTAPQVSIRAANIFSDQVYFEDCLNVIRVINGEGRKHNVKVNFFVPSVLPNPDSMSFDGDTIQRVIKMGYDETVAKLEKIANDRE